MKKYLNRSYAAALSSGTAALHLALRVLNVNKGDLVFCSDLTFVASPNAINYIGAQTDICRFRFILVEYVRKVFR